MPKSINTVLRSVCVITSDFLRPIKSPVLHAEGFIFNAILGFLCYNGGHIALSVRMGLRQTLAMQCLPVFIRIAYFKD